MAALSEDGSYGLNCGQQGAERVTVLHVKLTETALRAVENYQKSAVSETFLLKCIFVLKRDSRAASPREPKLPRTANANAKLRTRSDFWPGFSTHFNFVSLG